MPTVIPRRPTAAHLYALSFSLSTPGGGEGVFWGWGGAEGAPAMSSEDCSFPFFVAYGLREERWENKEKSIYRRTYVRRRGAQQLTQGGPAAIERRFLGKEEEDEEDED